MPKWEVAMSEKPGYWDVNRCAWVGAAPTNVLPPESSREGAAHAGELPEQRPADAAADATVAPA